MIQRHLRALFVYRVK